MKRILLFSAAGLALLLVLLAVLPFLVPSSVYKAQIEKAATQALGRDVIVSGDAGISIFPVISASVEDVSVANPEGFDEPHMIEAGALRGAVRILPLFSRRVEVSKLSFEDANVTLIRRADGVANWVMGGSTEADEKRPATAAPFSATIDKASLRNARVIYDDQQSGTRYVLDQLDAEASLKDAGKPMTFRANGVFQEEPFDLDVTLTSPETFLSAAETSLDIQLGSNLGNLGFEGNLRAVEPMEVNGRFKVNILRLAAVTEFLDLELPVDPEPLGGLQAAGAINGDIPALEIDLDELVISSDGLNAKYDGRINLASIPELDGTLSLSIRDSHMLSEQLGLGVNALKPFKQVSFSSKVAGPVDALSFTAVDGRTSSPTLTASYTGELSLAGEGKLDGDISAQTGQLRTLLEQLGVVVPSGDHLKSASITGRATGSFVSPGIKAGAFKLDQTEATGNLSADLQGETPRIVAKLDMPLLDLGPFLGQSSQPQARDEWSDVPLDLKGLGLVDADLQLTADTIDAGAVSLQQADVAAGLSNGRLDAELKRFSAFGGNWQGRAAIDSSEEIPSFRFAMSSSGIQTDELLGTLAGFDRLAGTGTFDLDVRSRGTSIRQIVNQLDGQLQLDIADGALAGINLGQLVRSAGSLKEIMASSPDSLSALGRVVSPEAETDFTSFNSAFGLQDGVARIQSLSLVNSVLNVSGSGQINLGGRTLDVRLTPAIDRTGQGNAATVQLNGIPVPLRIHGSWLSPRFSPDFSDVQSALTGSVRARAADAISEQLGGDIGSILSDSVNDSTDRQASDDSPSDGQEAKDQETGEKKAEDPEEKAIRDAFGAIFGPKEEESD